jgi:hypothetical protein
LPMLTLLSSKDKAKFIQNSNNLFWFEDRKLATHT